MPVVRLVVAPSSQRGFGRAAPLVVLALLALAAAGVAWKLKRSSADAGPVQITAPASPTSVPSASSPRDNEATDALLTRARGAVAAQHLLAPAGNNAFELYLAVRQRDPTNAAAAEALREVFPYAAEQATATIRDGDPAEAQRQLALLARADPTNYTLTLLRGQLAARLAAASTPPSPAATESAAVASRVVHAAPATVSAASSTPLTPPAATPAPAVPPSPTVAGQPAATHPSTPTLPPRPAAPAPPVVASSAPVLIRRIEPYYPREARRTRRQGWVEVEFTVTGTGDVANVAVLAAEPKNLFDHAATSAVGRWTFKPGTRDGKPVAMRLKQRLDFRL